MFYGKRQGTDEIDADWSESVMSVDHEAFKADSTDSIKRGECKNILLELK